jgi:glycosyltransferase involved in cell wall biosynthesis
MTLLLTIATVCKNSMHTICRTLESVLNFAKSNQHICIEHIIIDGGSTDHTLSIIERYSKIAHYKVKFESGQDTGIYNAMNKAILFSEGDYLLFLNSDDFLLPLTPFNAYQLALSMSSQKIILAPYLRSGKLHKNVQKVNYRFRSDPSKALKLGFKPYHPGFLAPQVLYKRYCFNESYRISADFLWMSQIMLDSSAVIYILDFPFIHFSTGGASSGIRGCIAGIKDLSRIYINLFGIQGILSLMIRYTMQVNAAFF